MAKARFYSVLQCWRRWQFSRSQVPIRFAEYPMVLNRGATDHHGVAAGFIKCTLHVLRCFHVTVQDDRYAHCRFYLRYPRPICGAIMSLRPDTTMDGKRLYAALFEPLSNFDNFYGFTVPSEP